MLEQGLNGILTNYSFQTSTYVQGFIFFSSHLTEHIFVVLKYHRGNSLRSLRLDHFKYLSILLIKWTPSFVFGLSLVGNILPFKKKKKKSKKR